MTRLAGSATSDGAEEVPRVASNVEEDRNPPIGLGPRFTDERDASLNHLPVNGVEVVNAEEEPDPAGYLVTDRGTLVFSVSASEQNPGVGTRRSDDNPPFGSPVIRQRRGVLDEVEAEYVGEERDRRVVLVDDQGNQVDLHHGSVRWLFCSPTTRRQRQIPQPAVGVAVAGSLVATCSDPVAL